MHAPLTLALLASVSAETILGSYIFQRHGDRLKKPTVYLTPVGTRQLQDSGNFYHQRYFEESAIEGLDSVYNASQFIIDTPSADVLWKSMLAFTHGFYPPVASSEASEVQGAEMSNDTIETTEGDLQYVFVDATDEHSDDYWKVVGGNGCTKVANASQAWLESPQFKQLSSDSAEFYKSLEKYLGGDFNSSKLNFANAFTVFDHFLTHDVHNLTFHNLIGGQDSEVFRRVRELQDQYTKGVNVNPLEEVVQLSGATILSQVKAFMEQVGGSADPVRVRVLGGAYDQFYKIFELLGWYAIDDSRFTGIVNYGSSLAFEVFRKDQQSDMMVRVGIRNGTGVTETDLSLDFYPVFGSSGEAMPLTDFLAKIKTYTTASWCQACGSLASVCEVDSLEAAARGKHLSDLTPAAYGGIGAGVTAGVFLLGAGLVVAWVLARRRPKRYDGESLRSEHTAIGEAAK